MDNDRAARTLELCGEHARGFRALAKTKPCKNLADRVRPSDKAQALSLVKEDVKLSHKHISPMFRSFRKYRLSESGLVVAAIARYIKHYRHDDPGLVLEALLGRLAAMIARTELITIVDELLLKAVKRKSSSCVHLLATRASRTTLDVVLREAVARRRTRCTRCLLNHGADPNCLDSSCLLTLMTATNVRIFEHLVRAQHPLRHETLNLLCTTAIQDCSTHISTLLLRTRCHTNRQSAAAWDRDGTMKALLQARRFELFYATAASTVNWPLADVSVFLDAIECTQESPGTRKTVVEILCCLTRNLNTLASTHSVQLFSRLIAENDCETMSVLVRYSRAVPPETCGEICRLGAFDMLDVILCDEFVGLGEARTTASLQITFDPLHILDLIRAMLASSSEICPSAIQRLLSRTDVFFASKSPHPAQNQDLYDLLSSLIEQDMQNDLEARMVGVLSVTQDTKLRYRQTFALGQTHLDELLIDAARRGLVLVTDVLLRLGACPRTCDTSGRSALFLAVLGGHEKVVKVLIIGQARVDDGSLHAAACEERWGIMEILQTAGHNPFHQCGLFLGATALETYVRHAYSPWPLVMDKINHGSRAPSFPTQGFPTTIMMLMREEHQNCSTARANDLVSVMLFTLPKQNAYALVSELLSHIEKYTTQGLLSARHVFRQGILRFSVLGLVERWPEVALQSRDREWLIERMRRAGLKSVFYVTKGDQPPYAIGVPEDLVEAQKRRTAFKTKECSVQACCAPRIREQDIYAALTAACTATHGWNDTIICAECLRSHVEARMFPLEDPEARYKFPSAKVPCWAPGCQVILDHEVIKTCVAPETFLMYDHSLLRRHLRTAKFTVVCANAGCPGALWFDESDDPRFTVFPCDECNESTCIECNDLYRKHADQPCPVGESRRQNERLQAEEALSKAALDEEKKCPRIDCGLAYEHLSGCDHIVCGTNVYDDQFDGKPDPVAIRLQVTSTLCDC